MCLCYNPFRQELHGCGYGCGYSKAHFITAYLYTVIIRTLIIMPTFEIHHNIGTIRNIISQYNSEHIHNNAGTKFNIYENLWVVVCFTL